MFCLGKMRFMVFPKQLSSPSTPAAEQRGPHTLEWMHRPDKWMHRPASLSALLSSREEPAELGYLAAERKHKSCLPLRDENHFQKLKPFKYVKGAPAVLIPVFPAPRWG